VLLRLGGEQLPRDERYAVRGGDLFEALAGDERNDLRALGADSS
jgi:hypothetical protein